MAEPLLDPTQLYDVMNTGNSVLLDVRSPKEYLHAHIPGAFSLPLLNDEERHHVGLTYKEQGHFAAVRKGFDLVGHKFSKFIDQAESLAPEKKIRVYCWRGGLRSSIMQWLLHLAGFQVVLIKGGYKRFRQMVLEELSKKRNIQILSGKTGVGKTEVLHHLEKNGEAVLDLESLANHKGSAFGALGLPPQPSAEHFENLIATKLCLMGEKKIWVESESRWIGKLKIPDALFAQMCTAPTIVIERDEDIRMSRILKEYGGFDVNLLSEKTKQLNKKMGGDQVKLALECLQRGDKEGWIKLLFKYYDKTYLHSLSQRQLSSVQKINMGNERDTLTIANMLINSIK